MADIVVVGSLNLDTTVRVPRLPARGETVLGEGSFTDAGGKGANQAVAAARLGRDVALVGAVGADAAGDRLLASLEASGVDVGAVKREREHPTGLALITVEAGGENTIVVAPGANAVLRPDDLEPWAGLLAAAAVVLLQLEIPLETVAAAAAAAGGAVVLNPAPGRSLPRGLLDRVDVLVPNETELAIVAGTATADVDQALAAARRLPGSVVVTLGAAGALVVEGGTASLVPAPTVDAVDPTAAGDAFCAGLADALAGGADLAAAARWAVRCGAVATTRWGAQAALPTRDEVEELR